MVKNPGPQGGYVITVNVEIGAAVAADNGFDLPGWAPGIAPSGAEPFLSAEGATVVVGGLIGATRTLLIEAAPNTKTVTDLTVVVDAATIADGEISQIDFNTLRNGIALVDGDVIQVMYITAPFNSGAS